MNSFALKIIALVTMIIDHMGAIMPDVFGLEFRVIGRVAFPIYVFLVAEGFRHTKNYEKFLLRLAVFALISEPVFDLAMGNPINFLGNTNIFYTLFFGGAAISAYKYIHASQPHGAKVLGLFVALFLMILAELASSDYGAYGVAFILCMYAIKPLKFRLAAMAIFCVWQHVTVIEFALRGVLFYSPDALLYLLMIPATLLPVSLVAFYNGERGVGLKWFFYASYPVHLGVLVVAAFLLN